jgi:hypothetical protein
MKGKIINMIHYIGPKVNICNCFTNIRISYQINKFSITDPVTFYSLITTLNVFELTKLIMLPNII